MASADFLEDGVEELSKEEDDDVDDRSHKKLLNAVSSLYKKQRIAAPKRNEPTLQISEFNLTKTEQKKKLAPTELLKGLGTKAIHKQIHDRVKNIKRQLKPLPKPLEKFEAEKITRETGYDAVTREVSKWEATIEKNRAADQLVFPLRGSDRISMEPERDILATFSKPTELELKMAEVLNKSTAIQELKEEAQAEKLTLGQLIQRRNMIAKMRHRESYRIAKAVRQNKIKSKKYHRLLKRDKIKNELKEFELLQKTDPQAALARLEKVERARAEERISLRHRNTGKWARGLAIRAKYDAEARAQLSENLRKSRELTEKVKASMVSDSEEEEDDGDDGMEFEGLGKFTENPWVNPENEVSSFVKGYRKFWENQNSSKVESNSVVGIVTKDVSNTVSSQKSEVRKSDEESEDNVSFGTEASKESDAAEESEGNNTESEYEGSEEQMSVNVIKMKEMPLGMSQHTKMGKKSGDVNKGHINATKLSNEKTKLRKFNKKLILGNKKAAISRVIQGKKSGEKKIVGKLKKRPVKSRKPAGGSKSRIEFHCYENPVRED